MSAATSSGTTSSAARYDADLPLWRDLAREAPEGVLDVGAGTGRVALRLAYAGHDVTALDIDPELLAVLEQRAPPTPACRSRRWPPTPTTSRSPSPSGSSPCRCRRSSCSTDARRLLRQRPPRAQAAAACVAVAIATELEPYDGAPPLPAPDIGEADGWTYVSQPIAIRVDDEHVAIERIRQRVGPDGERDDRPTT